MSYVQRVAEDQRLLALQHLAEQNDYTAHEHQIRAHLRDLGHTLSADTLRNLLTWLDEQGLVQLLGEQVLVARLTQRGEDAATGAARVAGVARPRPVA